MNEQDLRARVKHAAELHGVSARVVVDEVLDKHPDPKLSRRAHRVGWGAAVVVVGLVVGLVVIGWLKFVDGPVRAQAKVKLPGSSPSTSATAGTILLGGLQFTMSYPDVFDQVGQVKTDAKALEQYNLSSKANFRRFIAVDVRPLEANSLDNDSSYRVRQIHPADYKESSEQLAGERVAIMTKTDNQEQTLFWPHEGKLLTVSITNSNIKESVVATMKVIKPTIRWRK